MSSIGTIKQLNRQAYRAFHKDGIIDILVGVSLLGFGLWLQFDIAVFAFICWLSFGFYKNLKKTLTIPRFGYVTFQEDKKQFLLGMGVALMLIVLLLVARFLFLGYTSISNGLGVFLRKNHSYIMSSLGAVLLTIFGVWRGIQRFLVYGLLFLGLIILSYMLALPGQIPLLVFGISLMVIGVILLSLFIRNNPIKTSEAGNVN